MTTQAIDSTDPHPSADTAAAKTEFLFVQPFDGGTWEPKTGEDGVYTLTLSGAAANTVYFSDRPERIFGVTPNQQFLDGLGFTPNNPPNAALSRCHDGGDEQEVLVIELYEPRYDAGTQTLIYEAKVLADYSEHGLAHLARQQTDYELGETFGEGSLFIDDCSTIEFQCIGPDDTSVGTLSTKTCFEDGKCVPCQRLDELCGESFSQCVDCARDPDGNCIEDCNENGCQAAGSGKRGAARAAGRHTGSGVHTG